MFVGTFSGGIFLSTDDGGSWAAVNSGLTVPDVGIPDVNAMFIGKEYVLAGAIPVVWIRPLSDIVTSAPASLGQIPRHVELFQNYPNPFNPKTVIRYQVPAPSGVEGSEVSYVRLAVYDLLGREVVVLVNEEKAPGKYEVRFDGSGLASGMYVYRLTARQTDGGQAGDFVQSKKLVILK